MVSMPPMGFDSFCLAYRAIVAIRLRGGLVISAVTRTGARRRPRLLLVAGIVARLLRTAILVSMRDDSNEASTAVQYLRVVAAALRRILLTRRPIMVASSVIALARISRHGFRGLARKFVYFRIVRSVDSRKVVIGHLNVGL